jgi:hypothetical protein
VGHEPAIITGTMFFMTSLGCIIPMLAIPTPAFAVPYAAPRSAIAKKSHGKLKGAQKVFPLTAEDKSCRDTHKTEEGC